MKQFIPTRWGDSLSLFAWTPDLKLRWSWTNQGELMTCEKADRAPGCASPPLWPRPLWAPPLLGPSPVSCHLTQPLAPSTTPGELIISISPFSRAIWRIDSGLNLGTQTIILSLACHSVFHFLEWNPFNFSFKMIVTKEKTGSWYELKFWYIWTVKIVPFKLHSMQISVPKKPK